MPAPLSPRLVRRTHLALRARDALRPSSRTPALDGVRLVRRDACPVAEYRTFYRLVGERWHWRDRNAWSDDRLAEWLARPDVATWMLTLDGAPAGFFELLRHRTGGVEIVYFGLAAPVIGRGLGAWLLARAVEEAWAMGARWVGLNTCTLDGPHALANYLARGFVPYRTEEYVALV
jgi:GNAT superfamily N-acetyltransferase